MTAFVFLTVIASLGFAYYYTPPAPNYRIFPDLSITTATIGALVALNAAVALAWRIMPLWPFMTRYFMHAPAYPRAVQSVLNIFSHVQYEHLLGNMMMLCLAGPVCCDLVGRGIFLGTYISAGAIGTLVTLYWANLGRGNIFAHSVGASAAIWGISALYCLLTDQERIKIPFISNGESEGVSFWPKMLFLAFVVLEIQTARLRKHKTADHASHFGGMFVGICMAGYLRATGFLEKKRAASAEAVAAEGVQVNAGIDSKTVDVGAIAKQELKEVKDSLTRNVK